ncbi:hypothetical protein GIW70_13745 [Pseudomonas syringae]|nr:hypothetical protein [Pseudomonas syringae]MCF5069248.1 hypothetical protein [Pseudomonas syringae]
MAATKIVNGYLVNKMKDGQWNLTTSNGEHIAGPFPTEAMAAEVAAVFSDTPAAPKRRGKDQD